MEIIFGDFEYCGIIVYIENGRVHEADAMNDYDIGGDTVENRQIAIEDAKRTIEAWRN